MLRTLRFSSNVLFMIATIGFLLSLPSFNTMFSGIFGNGSSTVVGIYDGEKSRDLGVDNSIEIYKLFGKNLRETGEDVKVDVPVSYSVRLGSADSLEDDALYGVYAVYVGSNYIDLIEEAPKGVLRNWVHLEDDEMKTFKKLIKNPDTKLIDMSFI